VNVSASARREKYVKLVVWAGCNRKRSLGLPGEVGSRVT